ncbi:hypothetical protein ELG74_30555 (plasmid) [Rhizobium leguminosarum]|nr:hypothetical protein ELG74_30555 [Rhizobium leguminosarum]
MEDRLGRFEYLARSKPAERDNVFSEGIYIFYDRPRYVGLLTSDIDLSDFFVPNGAFNGVKYELHSPLTDNKRLGDAKDYLSPAADKPPSETSGKGMLSPTWNVWANLPPPPDSYVPRPDLEEKLVSLLSNDRHPIITLVGRGGIGKTSVALTVLHRLSRGHRFGAVVWFSARDIDLTQAGPKLARPDVLSQADIANQFSDLLEPEGRKRKEFKPTSFMAENMANSSLNEPILFVFDNFETVRSPIDVFNWIDANIRLPNKALITTRFRDFKADYPLEVKGMDRPEAEALIDNTATRFGSLGLFTGIVRDAIFEQSDGHPYIVKIIVGEITDKGTITKPEKIIASKDDILQALFERTFNNLSAGARRIFLTLCGWRSYVPQIAIEAVAFRGQHEGFDPEESVDELDRMSLIQKRRGDDGQDFVGIPLAAAIFGQKKLSTSPLRTAIEFDIKFLQELGATSATSLGEGVAPKIRKLVQSLAAKIADGKMEFADAQSLLEFIASRLPETWLLLADLVSEIQSSSYAELEREYLRRFIETGPADLAVEKTWDRLARLYRSAGQILAACDAYNRAFELRSPSYDTMSSLANWLNNNRDGLGYIDQSDRATVFQPLIGRMEDRINEASATDLSRLAWLNLHAGNHKRGEEVARLGMQMDPANIHCQRLTERLSKGQY